MPVPSANEKNELKPTIEVNQWFSRVLNGCQRRWIRHRFRLWQSFRSLAAGFVQNYGSRRDMVCDTPRLYRVSGRKPIDPFRDDRDSCGSKRARLPCGRLAFAWACFVKHIKTCLGSNGCASPKQSVSVHWG